jgi:hypothetical protein
MVNPIYYANSAGKGFGNLVEGDLGSAGLEALNFIPEFKQVRAVGKAAKNANKLNAFLTTINRIDDTVHASTGKDALTKYADGGPVGPPVKNYKKEGAELVLPPIKQLKHTIKRYMLILMYKKVLRII